MVRPIACAAGPLLEEAGGIVLSPRPGTVDVAFLGVRPSGNGGDGVVATVTFEVIAGGDPAIRIASIVARDAANREVLVPVSAPPPRVIPAVTALSFAAPSPFRERTTIAFDLAQSGPVEVALYSVTGQRVRELMRGRQEAGEYRLTWDGRDDGGRAVGAGVYYIRMVAAARQYTRAVIVLR